MIIIIMIMIIIILIIKTDIYFFYIRLDMCLTS